MRKPTTYRIPVDVQDKIDWLSTNMGNISHTDVVSIAVSELYERKRPTIRLVEQEPGVYDLMLGDHVAMSCDKCALEKLPVGMLNSLLEGTDSNGLAMVLLSAAASGQKIVLYPKAAAA